MMQIQILQINLKKRAIQKIPKTKKKYSSEQMNAVRFFLIDSFVKVDSKQKEKNQADTVHQVKKSKW